MSKDDKPSKTFIGDIGPESLSPPRKRIPYWGYFFNEPSKNQNPNCYIDPNLKENYRNRRVVKEGDTFIYKIRAMYDIYPGEELTLYYGENYERDYEIS